MNLAAVLVDLDRDDLLQIVHNRAHVKDFRLVNAADHKARGILAQRREDWLAVVQGNRNAIVRATRKIGGIDLHAFQVLTAAVEETSVATLAREELTEAEYELLVTPLATVCASWLLDGSAPPALDAEKAATAAEKPAGSLTDLKPERPRKPAPRVEDVDVRGLFDNDDQEEEDDDPLGLRDDPPELPSAPKVTQSAPKASGLFAAGLRRSA